MATDYQDLLDQAYSIRGADQPNSNTAERVGKLLVDLVEAIESGSGTYVHAQRTSAREWVVEHSMGRYPSVSVVDSAGTQVCGDVTYIDINTLKITFVAPFSGTAYLN